MGSRAQTLRRLEHRRADPIGKHHRGSSVVRVELTHHKHTRPVNHLGTEEFVLALPRIGDVCLQEGLEGDPRAEFLPIKVRVRFG